MNFNKSKTVGRMGLLGRMGMMGRMLAWFKELNI